MAAQRIDLETVRHVARLARLRLSSEEETRMQEDLSAVLAYVDKLNQLPTDDLEPTGWVFPRAADYRLALESDDC